MRAITVYCSSSPQLDPVFHEVASSLGKMMAENGLELVFGGGSIGLMGEIAQSARDNGCRTVGIITERLLDREMGDQKCDELIVVSTMRERRRLLMDRADAFIMLPGGIGTYEEFFEALVGRQLAEHRKPIGVVNVNGYFDPLLEMIRHGIEHRFIREATHSLMHIDSDPAVVLETLLTSDPASHDDESLLPVFTPGSGH